MFSARCTYSDRDSYSYYVGRSVGKNTSMCKSLLSLCKGSPQQAPYLSILSFDFYQYFEKKKIRNSIPRRTCTYLNKTTHRYEYIVHFQGCLSELCLSGMTPAFSRMSEAIRVGVYFKIDRTKRENAVLGVGVRLSGLAEARSHIVSRIFAFVFVLGFGRTI